MLKRETYRQGDVLLIRHDARRTPKMKLGAEEAREDGAVVLARGEVTGHKHQIRSQHASLFAVEDNRLTGESAMQVIARLGGGLIPDRLLRLEKPAELVHEEHSAIKLPAGNYVVRIQREYSPQSLRSVAD